MKLDYHYFLRRRNLSTHKLIINNQITEYQQLLKVLDRLKVQPLKEEEFNEAMIQINMKKNESTTVKVNEAIKEEKDAKKSSPRRSRAKRPPTKRRKKSSSTKDGNIS